MDGKKIAQSLDGLLSRHPTGHVLLGETGHENEPTFNAMLSNPDVMAVLQKHGIYHVALESRHEMQGVADAIAHGTAKPKDMGQAAVDAYKGIGDADAELSRPIYDDRGQLVESMSKRGFMVHFVERQNDLAEHLGGLERQNNITQKIVPDMLQNDLTVGQMAGNALSHGTYKLGKIFGLSSLTEHATRQQAAGYEQAVQDNPLTKRMMDRLVEERISGDKALADTIKERTHGERAVVKYGSDHGRHENDLSEHLGPDTVRIVLTKDRESFVRASQQDYTANFQKPDAYLVVEDGSMHSGTDAFAVSEQKFPKASPKAP